MKKRAWEPTKKDYEFIRENICMISPQEMADHFGVTLSTLNQEKVEAGIVIDEYTADIISCAEYELDRYLNRIERTNQWSLDIDVPDFTDRFKSLKTKECQCDLLCSGKARNDQYVLGNKRRNYNDRNYNKKTKDIGNGRI